jgi:AraC-like DNA-binding protein
MDDQLSRLLDEIRPQAVVCGRIEFTAPWGFRYAASDEMRFFIFLEGFAYLEVEDDEPVLVQAGDFVLLPRGSAHSIRDSLRSRLTPMRHDGQGEAGAAVVRLGGGGVRTAMIAGGFRLAAANVRFAMRVLPKVIHVRGRDGALPDWAPALVEASERAIASKLPGSTAILARLAELFLAHALQAQVAARLAEGETCPKAGEGGWRVMPALLAMHERPSVRWTIERLAQEAGMSRSAFAEAFVAAMGVAPMQHLLRVRMALAGELLRGRPMSMAAVAGRVGYNTEISFARAFKRHFGVTPGAYRRGTAATAPAPNALATQAR